MSIESTILHSDCLKDVRRFGRFSMAYSNIQEGMQEFRHPSFEGFIGFMSSWGRAYILSQPVTDPRDLKNATLRFLERYPRTVVCQASKEYAEVLSSIGFYVTGFGVEHVLPMKSFEVSYKHRPNLNRFFTRLRNLHFVVNETFPEIEQLSKINQDWLEHKQNKKEFRFLARPFPFSVEPDVRFFALTKEEQLTGFCTFDPIYNGSGDEQIVSYVLQHLRVHSSAPKGSADYLLINALNTFKAEGRAHISLGLAPLYQRAAPWARRSFFVELFLNTFYKGDNLYRSKNVGQHKDRYHADKVHTFLAYSRSNDLVGTLGIMKVNGLFG